MELKEVELKIINDLKEKHSIINNYFIKTRYGLENKQKLYIILHEMKSKGLVYFNIVEEGIFKGEPLGEIYLTKLGEESVL